MFVHHKTFEIQDLREKGIHVERATPVDSGPVWRICELRQETGSLHHIMAEAVDKNGDPDHSVWVYVHNDGNGVSSRIEPDKPQHEYGVQYPMWKGGVYSAFIPDTHPSDKVTGIQPLDIHTGEHQAVYVRWRLVQENGVPQPGDDPLPEGNLIAVPGLTERERKLVDALTLCQAATNTVGRIVEETLRELEIA